MIETGRVPGLDTPAFRVVSPDRPALPVLIAAPHGGRAYPGALSGRMRVPDTTKLRLEDRYVDRLAEEVAGETGAVLIAANAPRAMLDLNRAPDDMDWTMVSGEKPAGKQHSLANRRARTGLGLVPRRISGIGEIWRDRLSSAELDDRIAAIHTPYHAAVATILRDIRTRWGAALLVDLHSMPPLRRRHPSDVTAEFVLGDRFGASCDPMISATAIGYLSGKDRPVAHNRPYAGGYVLDRHGRPSLDIHALQVEVCRTLYLDRRGEGLSARMPMTARLLAGMVRALADELNRQQSGGRSAEAAE
ncbi:N-formylglutamate amidohydrolase [Erythrobacter sp. LQ02-29]|uniref:N-formylglutamate amidohydrolase n=1 Tax=Erythrobacter sp. LQ02-29 TaxID=2920384 RepID=UPI001F4EF506|nr:N-formylglutamate amidohydrolase [Erythrobacter sp. LQ02-29]